MTYTWLPELLAEIAEAAGLDAALKLAAAYGGVRRTFPARIRSDSHWLAACVGREAADKICAHFAQGSGSGVSAGIKVLVPLGPTGSIAGARRRLAQALAEGKSASEAARAAGMTERSAYRARSRARHQDDKQGRLF
jgi:hypothetical protein